jgi:hypothetical protein
VDIGLLRNLNLRKWERVLTTAQECGLIVSERRASQMTELYRIWWTLNELAKREPTAENIAAAAEALRRFEFAEAMLPELTF